MHRRNPFLQGLLELDELRDAGQRRSAWRGTIASIAQACAEDLPSPLEGLSPAAIGRSVKTALSAGLIDDLEWLSPASAAAALYEIAAALPQGVEKRELGRRVLPRLLDGDAATFVALATRMALGSGKGLSGEGVRARVALACSLPHPLGVRVDPLALALASRRELAREWVAGTATGSLPDWRLSGRLLELTARSIGRKVAQGDERPLRVLRGESVALAWARLLEDREPLVWRHVAVARGLLAAYHEPYAEQIERGFSPNLTPTEWRRAATSLTAHGAVRPEVALRKLRDVLARGALKRDPGAAAAFLWGVPAAAEVEPEVAAEMLDAVLAHAAPPIAGEALPEVIAALPAGLGDRAATLVRGALARGAAGGDDVDDGAVALRASLVAELDRSGARDASLVELVSTALRAFATSSARAAFRAGLDALAAAEGSVATLGALGDLSEPGGAGSIARRTAFAALRDLDTALLEDGTLRDLLVLGGRAPEGSRALEQADDLLERMRASMLGLEAAPTGPAAAHPTLRLRRLRALLHLADARSVEERDEGPESARTKERSSRIATAMLRHLTAGPDPTFHRTISAAFARASDGLVRASTCNPADVLLVVAQRGLSVADLSTLAEASMDTDARALFTSFSALLRAMAAADAPPATREPVSLAAPSIPPSAPPASLSSMPPLAPGPVGSKIAALSAFAKEVDSNASMRIEALRTAILRLSRSLAHVLAAPSLADVAGGSRAGVAPIAELEAALGMLVQLVAGARQRFGDAPEGLSLSRLTSLAPALDAAVEAGSGEGLDEPLATARAELAAALPPLFADLVIDVIETLRTLPAQSVFAVPGAAHETATTLPAWMPRRRTLGGFYVVRALGAGAGGTVFVARRIEDRHDERAERFALKVPDYDGNAARALSEEQFMKLFQEEATALLAVPRHPNLARFVTFDVGARPKPILVMELVEGMSLERVIAARSLDVPRALEILDGILAGLSAMHGAGVGHLDVKPSNVILRGGREPVLVDFGLAGRHIRPGCATLQYGPPEVWGVAPEGHVPAPQAADVYSFACLAFEVLAGEELFSATTEMALVGAHVSHDGWPPKLATFAQHRPLAPVAELLFAALRHDPRARITVAELRPALAKLRAKLAGEAWPLSGPRRA